jgi:hypothetical protein
MEINSEVLGTFFYRKKKALLPLAKASLSACRPLCWCVGSKPLKKLLYEDKTLGLCSKPYHLLKNKALLPTAKVSLSAYRPLCRCVGGRKFSISFATYIY